jgi:hypothetical protein
MLSSQAVFNNRFKHIDVKRLIDQFAKANDDPDALADLVLTDLESGFKSFSEIGDYEPMVDHLYAMLDRLQEYLQKLTSETLPRHVERLQKLAEQWGAQFGYGISDQLTDFAYEWGDRLKGAK